MVQRVCNPAEMLCVDRHRLNVAHVILQKHRFDFGVIVEDSDLKFVRALAMYFQQLATVILICPSCMFRNLENMVKPYGFLVVTKGPYMLKDNGMRFFAANLIKA